MKKVFLLVAVVIAAGAIGGLLIHKGSTNKANSTSADYAPPLFSATSPTN